MGSRGTRIVIVLALGTAWFASKALDARTPTWDAPFDEPEPTSAPIDLDEPPPPGPAPLYVTVEYDQIEMPVPGAVVDVADGEGRQFRQTVDAAGWAVFPEVRSPEPIINVEAGGWELVTDPELERLADGSRLATLRVAWGRPLVGLVVDADTGAPIGGARVRAVLQSDGDDGRCYDSHTSRTVESDADGRFRIPAFEHRFDNGRRVRLDATERRHATVRTQGVSSFVLATSDGLTVRMPSGRSIIGTARLSDGRPASQARIRATDRWAQDEWRQRSTVADDAGRWRIDGLPIGVPTSITAESSESRIPVESEVPVATDDAGPVHVDLAFSPVARLEVRVVDADDVGVPGVELVLSTPSQKERGYDRATRTSDHAGVVSFDVATRGEQVGYVDTDRLVRPDTVGPDGLEANLGSRFEVRLAPDGFLRVTLVVPGPRASRASDERRYGRRVWGRVVNERGRPFGRAVIQVETSGWPRRIVSDDAGAFAVLARTASDLSLYAEAPGCRGASARADASGPVRVVLTRREIVRFVVVAPGGAPTWSRLRAQNLDEVLVAPPLLSSSGQWELLAAVAATNGSYDVRVEADNGVGTIVGSVGRCGARGNGTTLLRPGVGASVSGRVVDDVGDPVPGTPVLAEEWGVPTGYESQCPDRLRSREAVTGLDGRFLLTGFGDRGSIDLIVARGETFEGRTSIESEFGHRDLRCPGAVEIRLARHGTIVVTTRDALGHRRRGIALKLRETVAPGDTTHRSSPEIYSDDAGECELRRLPGTYEILEFGESNRRTEATAAAHPVVVRPGRTTSLDLVVGSAPDHR